MTVSENSTSTDATPPSPPGLVQEKPNDLMEEPDSELEEGIALLSALKIHCAQCGATETPQWRKGWLNFWTKRPVNLCNACGLKYNKRQYCPYCNYIYRKNEDKSRARKLWVNCSHCPRLVHVDCERSFRNSKFVPKSDGYLCPECSYESQGGKIPFFDALRHSHLLLRLKDLFC